MPKRDPRGSLLDMRAYALAAIRIAGEMTLDELRASEVSRLALERALEVVGEAANRVPKKTRDTLSSIPWAAIVGLRNILAHAYDSVRDEILLNVVRHNLPELVAKLDAALARQNAGEA